MLNIQLLSVLLSNQIMCKHVHTTSVKRNKQFWSHATSNKYRKTYAQISKQTDSSQVDWTWFYVLSWCSPHWYCLKSSIVSIFLIGCWLKMYTCSVQSFIPFAFIFCKPLDHLLLYEKSMPSHHSDFSHSRVGASGATL